MDRNGRSMLIPRLAHAIAEIDEQLRETAFRSRVVAQDGAEGCVAEGVGETLAQGFAGAGVVGQTIAFSLVPSRYTGGSGGGRCYRRKQRTTCLSSRTVCCSTREYTMFDSTVPTA